MNINDVELSESCHVVILGAGASIASTIYNPESRGFKLPSMKDLPSVVGLNDLLTHFSKDLICEDDFEATYSNIAENVPNSPFLKEMNDRIYSYFKGLKLPNIPTIYDYLVMSLRNKDVIATFNWDPFLYQAWIRNYNHGSSPLLLFLHGNVAVGYNEQTNRIGWSDWTSPRTGDYYSPTQLLYPVKHKNYTSDIYIQKQWTELKRRLSPEYNTNNITIFGYSAPVSDVEALAMMKDAWDNLRQRNLEQFEFIDIKEEKEILKSWSRFVYPGHYNYVKDFFDSSLALYPRRTEEAWFCHYVSTTEEEFFVESNPVPRNFSTFQEMWDWYQPLIDKE